MKSGANEYYRRLQHPRISTSTYFQGVGVAINSDQIARAHVWLANHQNRCEPIRRRVWYRLCPPPQLRRHPRLVDRSGHASRTTTTRSHLQILHVRKMRNNSLKPTRNHPRRRVVPASRRRTTRSITKNGCARVR